MNDAIARMERLWAHHGPELSLLVQSQALVAMATTFAMFLISVEVSAYAWKTRMTLGPKAGPTLKFWSIFLLIPVFVLAVRLTSSDELMALFGNPHALIAAYAIQGLDANPGGTYPVPERTVLEHAVTSSLSGRAVQTLWPALLLLALSVRHLHTRWKNGRLLDIQGAPLAAAALGAVVVFTPIVADPILWSAAFGNGNDLLDAVLRTSVAERTGP